MNEKQIAGHQTELETWIALDNKPYTWEDFVQFYDEKLVSVSGRRLATDSRQSQATTSQELPVERKTQLLGCFAVIFFFLNFRKQLADWPAGRLAAGWPAGWPAVIVVESINSSKIITAMPQF